MVPLQQNQSVVFTKSKPLSKTIESNFTFNNEKNTKHSLQGITLETNRPFIQDSYLLILSSGLRGTTFVGNYLKIETIEELK